LARKRETFDNIFAETDKEKFLINAINAQADFSSVSNPYVGNKRKMLVDIIMTVYENLRYNEINCVCDLFAGSSVVGSFFKKLGKTVYSNELLKSSYMNGVALQNSERIKISLEEWEFVVNNNNKNADKFIETKYAGKRFTQKEAQFIDNYYANAKELCYQTCENKYCVLQSTIMQFIMSHCFVGGRLNNGQVVAALEHRLQHQRNNNCEMDFSKMRPFNFNCGGPESYFSNSDVFDFLNRGLDKKPDLIYIDPPYGGQQSDYAAMYQFFEEYLARTDFEGISYLKGKSDRFSKTKTYKESFEELLIALPKDSYWMISYNDSSWEDIDTIVNMLLKHKTIVSVKELEYSYKYRSAENVSGVEYLIVGQ